MPFYEYECSHCHYYTEALQKISDAPLRKCPACGRLTFRKLVSAPVFRLKGKGWYETDFKSEQENKRNLAAPEQEPAKGTEKPAAEAGSESKSTAADSSPKPDKSDTPAKPAKAPDQGAGKSPGRDGGSRSHARTRISVPATGAKARAARKSAPAGRAARTRGRNPAARRGRG